MHDATVQPLSPQRQSFYHRQKERETLELCVCQWKILMTCLENPRLLFANISTKRTIYNVELFRFQLDERKRKMIAGNVRPHRRCNAFPRKTCLVRTLSLCVRFYWSHEMCWQLKQSEMDQLKQRKAYAMHTVIDNLLKRPLPHRSNDALCQRIHRIRSFMINLFGRLLWADGKCG